MDDKNLIIELLDMADERCLKIILAYVRAILGLS